MGNSRYVFNPESLQYDEVKLSSRKKIMRMVLTPLLAGIVIAVILFIAFSNTIDTPEEKRLKRENAQLQRQYDAIIEKYRPLIQVLEDLEMRDDNIYRAIFETEPLPDEHTIRNDGSSLADFDEKNQEELLKKTKSRITALSTRVNSLSTTFDNLMQQLKDMEVTDIPSIQPLDNKGGKYHPYGFGNRIDPIYRTPTFHQGMDFAAPEGTPIRVTANGTVEKIDNNSRAHGKMIKIRHSNGYHTLYAHLSKISVRRGQTVEQGEIIGEVGNTGKSIAPHLHYEVHKDGEPVNPVHFFFNDLTPEEYHTLLQITSRGGQSLD